MRLVSRVSLLFSLAFSLSVATVAGFAAENPHIFQRPALSRDLIAFGYAGDLWTVSREGGKATRLTTGVGIETAPVFSPDGKTLAFTGEYDGNTDVFTIPVTGGIPFRVTYHPAADFAVGWTPCVSGALGAILALASIHAGSAFLLLMAYTLGVGIPFLLVGLFTDRAQKLIEKAGKWMVYLEYIFGILLIVIGVLIFTSELSQIANFQFLTTALTNLNIGTSTGSAITSLTIINLGIAFFAGLVSFFSPCILPIIPGFLSYLASTAIKTTTQ